MKRNFFQRPGIVMLALVFLVSAAAAEQPPSKTSAKTQKQPAGKTPVLAGKTVNINKVNEAELVKNVPLITPDLAKRIVKYRKDNGDFQTLEELLEIDGFNRDLLRRIKPFLLLEGIGGKDCTC